MREGLRVGRTEELVEVLSSPDISRCPSVTHKAHNGDVEFQRWVLASYRRFHVTHDAHLLPSTEGLLCYRTSVMWEVSIESDRTLAQDLVSLSDWR